MTTQPPIAALPALAVALVSGVLTVQLTQGGGKFEPIHTADPCLARHVTSQAHGIDALTERLVLIGLDEAACRLHVSREALTLELARPGSHSDAEIGALREGLKAAVRRMKADETLPPVSDLVDEALDNADMNGFLKAAIKALPDSVIDAALKTDDVLARAIDNLDLREVLGSLDDQQGLNRQMQAAITQAVKDSLAARLRDLL